MNTQPIPKTRKEPRNITHEYENFHQAYAHMCASAFEDPNAAYQNGTVLGLFINGGRYLIELMAKINKLPTDEGRRLGLFALFSEVIKTSGGKVDPELTQLAELIAQKHN